MIRTCAFTPLLLLALATPVGAATDDAALVSAKTALQSAVDGSKSSAVLGARAELEALAVAEPGSAALHYWVALADWRLVPLLQGDAARAADKAAKEKKSALAGRYAKDGLDQLGRALELDPTFADAFALLGGLQGMSIAFDPGAMMTLGPQSQANLRRALGLAPANPRVWLLDGIGTLNTPEMYGGGAKPALEKFQKAQALFEADSAATAATPDWGRADSWLWGGRAAMKLEDYAAAKTQFEKALALAPDNVWVKMALLPAAEKALAAKQDH